MAAGLRQAGRLGEPACRLGFIPSEKELGFPAAGDTRCSPKSLAWVSFT